jgi:hypothetical protein
MKDSQINVFYSRDEEGPIATITDLKYGSVLGILPETIMHKGLIARKPWIETLWEKQFHYPPTNQIFIT